MNILHDIFFGAAIALVLYISLNDFVTALFFLKQTKNIQREKLVQDNEIYSVKVVIFDTCGNIRMFFGCGSYKEEATIPEPSS